MDEEDVPESCDHEFLIQDSQSRTARVHFVLVYVLGWPVPAPQVLLADSRVKHIPYGRYRRQTLIEARTWPDLNEFEEFNRVTVYKAG